METNQKITYGILGLLTVLMGFGGSLLLTQDQINHAYVCSTNEKVGFFDSLSSTSKTGYYVDELNVSKSSVCTNGQWIKLEAYANSKGVSIDSLLQKELNKPVLVAEAGKSYICDQSECREKS